MWKIGSILSVVLLLLGYNDAQDDNYTDYITNAPTPDTREPTVRPSSFPTITPTEYPTVGGVSSDKLLVLTVTVPVTKVTLTDVEDEQEYFEALLGDSFELDINEVDVKLRRAQENDDIKTYCNKTGVDITYEVISDDTDTYTIAQQSIDEGNFETIFNEGLSNVYSENSFVCTEIPDLEIITSAVVEDADDVYTPAPDPTFTEQVWNEYLFFGFATSVIGVVWLWYLRTEVGDEGIYKTNNNNNKKGNTNSPPKGTRMATNSSAQNAGATNDTNNGNSIEMQGPKGSSNALMEDDGNANNTGDKSTYT